MHPPIGNEFTVVEVKSPRFDEFYIRYLESKVILYRQSMWLAVVGWGLTILWGYYK